MSGGLLQLREYPPDLVQAVLREMRAGLVNTEKKF